MKFIDEVTIVIKAGSGGNGSVSFLHSYLNPLSGPDGGNGGKGGDVYFRGEPQLNSLHEFSTKKKWFASDGENGGKGLKTGRSGDNLYINVPLGTIIYIIGENNTNLPIAEIIDQDQLFLALKGGQGGQGNSAFSSSVNRTPRYAQNGVKTESIQVKLELIVIADVGLLGLPNAGKSTLLNALTNANSSTGDYPFTTLNPQLGVVNESQLAKKIILADLPGIIEKASENKGLGIKFLKHAKRCKVLIFVIDSASDQPFKDLEILRKELAVADHAKFLKEQFVIWNKIDLLSIGALSQIRKKSQQLKGINSFFVSALKSQNLDNLVNLIDNVVRNSGDNYSLFREKSLYRVYDFTRNPIGLELKKLKESYWKISGPYIEKITHQSKTSSSQEKISKSLDTDSVKNFLLKNGVKNGDVLLINNQEYFWK